MSELVICFQEIKDLSDAEMTDGDAARGIAAAILIEYGEFKK